MKIQNFINNRHKYKVDTTYQRPSDAWSTADNQCFVDTILRGEAMPIFFLNHISKEDVYYIVDGQQRLNAIKNFHDNKLRLNKRFSGEENHGKTFNSDKPLSGEQRKTFLDYKLNFRIMEDYDDERVRLIFSRLQRGKPLTLGERLNAMPGEIVQRMREIALHPFIRDSIGIYKGRYGAYPDAARILFYEKFGAKQCGSNELYNFFENHKNLKKKDNDYQNAISTLNFLAKCFPTDPGNYKFLEKHAWVLATYTMVRDLMVCYSLHGKEDTIRNFTHDFHNKVYSEDFRNSNVFYQRFYDHVRGGWSEKIIALRRNILIQEFLKKYDIKEFDKRQISDEQKIAKFAIQSNCEVCGRSFKDYKEPEYHHKTAYAKGGKSELENIMVLCSKCHKEIHSKEAIEVPSEDELPENDEM